MVLLAFAESIQLFPDGTLFIHIGLILLMIWVLNRTFFRPVNAVIASREKFKGGRNIEAEEIAGTAAEKQARYLAELQAARTEGYGMIEKERDAALAARNEIVSLAKSQTAAAFESEKQQLRTEAEAARAAISSEAEAIADRISANILKV